MTGFAADWLRLRASADRRARNRQLAAALQRHFAGHRAVTVLDLGAGSGNNMAATAPLLPKSQHWRLVDSDPVLLAAARPAPGVVQTTLRADLARGIGPLLVPRPDLVTASAFFDIAGAAWIDRLVADLAGAGLPLYAVLSYTGHERWDPPHPADEAALAAFHVDQQRDKGLGPALGPAAAAHLAAALQAAGYRVEQGASDWQLEATRDAGLIAALARSSAAAVAPALGPAAADWGTARERASRVTISHTDILALPG
ncbi:hypothetical protein LNKW23_11010 [Paralimibaculum aggregatum]|uniref:SAM-dependent methyltransferase n=1 Tax=Paralimibaculum aggregatum TaxID=3036245 RepID=A0ABQ6LEY5_9RHOB|nr:class I SAM-dependent methyltransferase [Limibaculum sp. NKW23]GMG81888.1 hypothetical protein LNKW23_11010 [Limibaculum sp. NKW23]